VDRALVRTNLRPMCRWATQRFRYTAPELIALFANNPTADPALVRTNLRRRCHRFTQPFLCASPELIAHSRVPPDAAGGIRY